MEGIKVDTELLNSFCSHHNLLGWFPTSAKDNINIGKYCKTVIINMQETIANNYSITDVTLSYPARLRADLS